jgi:NTP pyrophosphatase (non-canonical NTP hydrolase)
MDYAQYVTSREAVENGIPERMLLRYREVHAISKLATEAGELLDCLMKTIIYNKPLDTTNIIEELGDIEFYLQQIRNIYQLNREDVLAANVRKLDTRYPQKKFNEFHAQVRDTEAERAAIERNA